MSHTDTVQRIYAAFGAGDVESILAALADDVEWEYGPETADVPWLRHRRGRGEVPAFFSALQELEIHRFRPTAVLGSGAVVVALVDLEATVRATGVRITEPDEVHIWYFNEAGLVQKFRHRVDTLQHRDALRHR